jgi:hypothetical protein
MTEKGEKMTVQWGKTVQQRGEIIKQGCSALFPVCTGKKTFSSLL